MRTSRLAGFPIALTGLAFLAVGLDVGGILFAAEPADLQTVVTLGPAEIPAATAALLQSVFLAVGAMTVVFGIIVRFRGRAPNV